MCIFNLFSDGSRDLLNYRIRLFTTTGSIFQYWFLGEVQLKKFLKKGAFCPKNGVLFKKNPKNRTFEKAEVAFKSGAVYERIR